MSKVTLLRHNSIDWIFEWNDKYSGYVFFTKNSVYKIFFDNCLVASKYGFEPDIWIGRLDINSKLWFTCEKKIKAKTLIMFRGQYNFN